MTTEGGWKPKGSLDQDSRRTKAAKIVNLIEQHRPLAGARLLEIGTGGGVITSLLAEHVGSEGEVWSVDVEDLRVSTDGYNFRQVDGTVLPFEDDEFDVVVSNHTIEHVGSREDQLVHLREIARTMRDDGLGYLASPSRWALVEPHFKVPMLSWLPVGARDQALRLSRRGTVYDINPQTRTKLGVMIDEAGLDGEEITLDALQTTAQVEGGPGAAVASRLPGPVLQATRGAIPTMIFLLRHRS